MPMMITNRYRVSKVTTCKNVLCNVLALDNKSLPRMASPRQLSNIKCCGSNKPNQVIFCSRAKKLPPVCLQPAVSNSAKK